MAVHKHRTGWRGLLTLTMPVYNTKAETEAALADLRARVQTWRFAQEPEPAPAATRTLDPHIFIPSCDYPRPFPPSF
jgi:hypothetical protein